MPKTIFNTTEKSNFILNMDLDFYRRVCRILMIVMLAAVGGSMAIFQLTEPVNSELSELLGQGGFGGVLAFLLIGLRSTAIPFSVLGVLATVFMFIGVVRKQATKTQMLSYALVVGMLIWAMISLYQSFDYNMALFGQDGRNEGWIALLFYGALFYLGTMLRKRQEQECFVKAILIYGLVQLGWGVIQALPTAGFPNAYRFVDPLLYDNLYLPSGLTDSPVTYAMLLAMLLAIAIPAARREQKTIRILAMVTAGLAMLLTLVTRTIAGVLAMAFGLVWLIVQLVLYRKEDGKRLMILTGTVCAALCVSVLWTYFAPSINDSYKTSNDKALENGFFFCDGGIVWDDAAYRLSTSGPYAPHVEHDFEIYDATSVLEYTWSEGIRVIKKYPILGTGADNFSYTQLRESYDLAQNRNSIDRPYNEWLYVAATRGIPSLLMYVVLIGASLYWSIRNCKSSKRWVYMSASGAVIGYVVTSMVGISALTITPLFWMMMGMAAGSPMEDEPSASKQGKQRPKKA